MMLTPASPACSSWLVRPKSRAGLLRLRGLHSTGLQRPSRPSPGAISGWPGRGAGCCGAPVAGLPPPQIHKYGRAGRRGTAVVMASSSARVGASALAQRLPSIAGYELLVAQAAFGASLIMAKIALPAFGPELFAGFRAIITLPLLAAAALCSARARDELQWGTLREHVPYLALLGFVGIFCEQLLTAHGLALAGATKFVVIGQLVPIYTTVAGVFRSLEAPSLTKLASMSL
mmetsp:Transcript_28333/g.90268  ORF Transcript_28333/g.90268 Transcript_28333/m.90268 type:complete len:232 (-) Transcript_28333:86-781(-)